MQSTRNICKPLYKWSLQGWKNTYEKLGFNGIEIDLYSLAVPLNTKKRKSRIYLKGHHRRFESTVGEVMIPNWSCQKSDES